MNFVRPELDPAAKIRLFARVRSDGILFATMGSLENLDQVEQKFDEYLASEGDVPPMSEDHLIEWKKMCALKNPVK